MERTKLPLREVIADDLVIEIDGIQYRPHAGESVTFHPGGESLDDYLLQMRVLTAQSLFSIDDGIDASKVAEFEALSNQAISRLASRIAAWTWTDNQGVPYESPPTVDVLRKLGTEESLWLSDKASNRKKKSDDESKNGDTPST